MNRLVTFIWGGLLLVSTVAVIPIILVLLQRARRAAQEIEHSTAEILTSGAGIARNTSYISGLQQTLSLAPSLVSELQSIEQQVIRIRTSLAGHSGGDGKVSGEEGLS